MVTKKQSGKAFEYAVVTALVRILGEQNVIINRDSNLITAEKDFFAIDSVIQDENLRAAISATKYF